MKSYDEITASVLQAAELRALRIRRTRNICTMAAACLAFAIGGAAFMKMEMPTFLPEDPYEYQTDSFHSASDPSTELPTEPTAETTPPPTEPPTTTTAETTTTTTAPVPVTQPLPATQATTRGAEIVTVYVETEPAALVTSIPGETHTSLTTKQTTTFTFRTTETTESTTLGTTTTEITSETDPVETTTESTATSETVTEFTETSAAETTVLLTETVPAVTELPAETTAEVTLPDITAETVNLTEEEWQLLYDMYLRGELPFTFEFLKLPVEGTTETTTESLFPFPIT